MFTEFLLLEGSEVELLRTRGSYWLPLKLLMMQFHRVIWVLDYVSWPPYWLLLVLQCSRKQ